MHESTSDKGRSKINSSRRACYSCAIFFRYHNYKVTLWRPNETAVELLGTTVLRVISKSISRYRIGDEQHVVVQARSSQRAKNKAVLQTPGIWYAIEAVRVK